MRTVVSGSILFGTGLGDRPIPRHFAALARELVKHGRRVGLLVHGPSDDRTYVDPRVEVFRWPSPRPTRLADALFFNRLVAKWRPACVIGSGGSTTILMTVGALRSVPVRVHWYHTLSSQIEQDWQRSRLVGVMQRWRARVVYRLATHTVANSVAGKQDVSATYGVPASQCAVFWNCLEDPFGGRTLAITEAASPQDKCRFVCVGRFVPSKDQDVLIRAVAQIVRCVPQITVEFVGGGPTKEQCERLVQELKLADRCLFTGSLPHREVLSKMANARATIVPSRAEAFGLVNIESMAVGVPVIGSDTGGIKEILRDGVDGFLFPPGDYVALGRRMLDLVENESLRNRMAANCRARFLEQFESSHAVRSQARWLEDIIKRQFQSRLSIGQPA